MANGMRHPGSFGVGGRSRVVQDYDKRPSQHGSPWWSSQSLYGSGHQGPPGSGPPGVRPPFSPREQTGPPGTAGVLPDYEREALLLELLAKMAMGDRPPPYGMGKPYKNPLWREARPDLGVSLGPPRVSGDNPEEAWVDRALRAIYERMLGNHERAAGASEGLTLDPGMKALEAYLVKRDSERARERRRPRSEADYLDPRYASRGYRHAEGFPGGVVEMPRVPVDPGFFSNMPMVPKKRPGYGRGGTGYAGAV